MARLVETADDLTEQSSTAQIDAHQALEADRQMAAWTELAAHLPQDLIIYMAGSLDLLDLLRTARVCRHWRSTIINCASLWARLDLYDIGHQSLRALPQLLPLSGNTPLTLRVWFKEDDGCSHSIELLCSQLQPHLHRLRALAVRSRHRPNYIPLFNLLDLDAPLLRHLDVSHDHREYVISGQPPNPPNTILALAPHLSFVNWGSHTLPEAPSRLSELTHVRIDVPSIPIDQVFSLFPCVRTLHLDIFNASRDVEPLSPDHPLTTLTLGVQHIEHSPYPISWAQVQSLGFGRVALLRLCQYAATVVIHACQDRDWQLTSVKIDYDDFVDASFTCRNLHSQCRMTDLAPYRGKTWGMLRLMCETDWLRALESLTLSMELSVEQKRPSLLLPCGRLPALREFSLICGTEGLKGDGKVERWGSLLDENIMAICGLLEAPQLRVLRLLSRTRHHSGSLSVISPAAVARFISGHVQIDGAPVPLLKISIFLQLEDDPAGLAALRAAVDAIQHWI